MTRPKLTIRRAHLKDASALAKAERAITQAPGRLVSRPSEVKDDRFAEKIAHLASADNGLYLVAESEGELVGHGMLDPLPLAAIRHVVRLTLVSHPGWHRRGVGEALLRALIEWARVTPAVEKIELNVRSSNDGAQALYRKLGFEEMGRWRRRVKIGPGEYLDDVAMELFVDAAGSF